MTAHFFHSYLGQLRCYYQNYSLPSETKTTYGVNLTLESLE